MDKDVIHAHTHTHTEYHSPMDKNAILSFAISWMELEGFMISEISQTEKDKYLMLSLYVESKKESKLLNITKRNKLTDVENKQVATSRERKT